MRIYGIDPDVERSGVACITERGELLSLKSLQFCELIDHFSAEDRTDCEVVVEGGWLNSSNWHAHGTAALAAKIGNAAGRNHQIGILIVEMLEHLGYSVKVAKPLRKCWYGADRKITHDELVGITHITKKRTNQEERDALLLAWVYACLPMRLSARTAPKRAKKR